MLTSTFSSTPWEGTFSARPGVHIDEAACFDSLARDNDVAAALIVCYTDCEGNDGNNEYVIGLQSKYDWVRPATYIKPDNPPNADTLETWRDQGVVGLVMYPRSDDAVRAYPDSIWEWLTDIRWVLSVNAKIEAWPVWQEVLERHKQLRLIMSHLGLPDRVTEPIDGAEARNRLSDVLALARYPQTSVKLSGFYALTEPGHDYPHELAWPYVEALIEAFGVERLLFASDYAPCLNFQTYPQTLELLWKMPFLRDDDRDRIAGGNLMALLQEAAA